MKIHEFLITIYVLVIIHGYLIVLHLHVVFNGGKKTSSDMWMQKLMNHVLHVYLTITHLNYTRISAFQSL